MEGKYPFPCPAVLGHESAGVVGGHCSQCTDGHLTLCENKGSELVGGPVSRLA